MNALVLDFGVAIAEIILWFIVIHLIHFLTIITLKRFAQWFSTEAEFNLFVMAQQIINKCTAILKLLGVVCILGINGYLFYQQKSISRPLWTLISGVPIERWQMLALGSLKSILLLILVTLIIASLHPWLKSVSDRLKAWKNLDQNNSSIDKLFWATELAISNGLWILSLVICLDFLFVPVAITKYFYLGIKFYFMICLGIVAVKGSFAGIDTLDALYGEFIAQYPNSFFRFYPRFRYLLGLSKRCLEFAVYVAIAGLILDQLAIFNRLASYVIPINKIILVIFLAALSIEVANILVEKLLLRSPDLTPFQRRRRLTFIPLVQNTARYCIYFAGGVALLSIFSIDPTPILAGAGIIGLAVGLGAQNLINDLVNGFSILLQNYYLVGDFVETDTATGVVEEMDLRVTRIRSPSGTLHIVRNGDIKTIVNYSKDYVYAVVIVGVDYDSNLDHVYRVLETVGQQVKELHPDVLEPTRIDGLENFAESELTIRTCTKVKPGKHLPVQRLVRKLIKEAFDRENVEIPFARRVLIFKNDGAVPAENSHQLREALLGEDEDGQL